MPRVITNFTFQELLEKRPKSQAEAMLCQAIAALSTQPQFSNMTPWEVFQHIKNTSQHWDEEVAHAARNVKGDHMTERFYTALFGVGIIVVVVVTAIVLLLLP